MNTRRNTLYNIAYRVFSIFLPLVTAPYLSRVVGREGVGLYSYAWSVSYIFCLIGLLGLENYGVRAIARVRDDRAALDRTFSQIVRMQAVVAGAALGGYLVYACFIAGAERSIALSLTMMSISCLCNLDWCLMGLDRFKAIALRNTSVKLLAAAAVFIFIKKPEDLWVYGFVWSLATLLGCVSCCCSLRGRVRLIRVPWREVWPHLKPCSVLFISVIAVSVYRTMDKVMVGALSSMEQNGLYENAEKIIYCLSGFISAVGTVMLPKVSAMFRRGEKEQVVRHITVSMQAVLCMVCAMAFGIAAIADRFAPLFFGEDFTGSGTLMVPLAFTLVTIGFANVIRTQWILPQSRDAVFVKSVSCGAAVNLIANALLIPRLGAMGAVIGTLLAEGTVPLVQFIILRKELPYGRYLTDLAAYAVIGGVMLAGVRLTAPFVPEGWLGLAVQVAAGGCCYAMLCLLLWIASGNAPLLRLIPVVGRRLAKRVRKAEDNHAV